MCAGTLLFRPTSCAPFRADDDALSLSLSAPDDDDGDDDDAVVDREVFLECSSTLLLLLLLLVLLCNFVVVTDNESLARWTDVDLVVAPVECAVEASFVVASCVVVKDIFVVADWDDLLDFEFDVDVVADAAVVVLVGDDVLAVVALLVPDSVDDSDLGGVALAVVVEAEPLADGGCAIEPFDLALSATAVDGEEEEVDVAVDAAAAAAAVAVEEVRLAANGAPIASCIEELVGCACGGGGGLLAILLCFDAHSHALSIPGWTCGCGVSPANKFRGELVLLLLLL
jgi:hypothetical protein